MISIIPMATDISAMDEIHSVLDRAVTKNIVSLENMRSSIEFTAKLKDIINAAVAEVILDIVLTSSTYTHAANSSMLDAPERKVAIRYDHETHGVVSLHTSFINLALCRRQINVLLVNHN